MQQEYVVLVELKDETFYGTFPDFPGLICEADNINELISGCKEALEKHRKNLKKVNGKIPLPFQKSEVLHYNHNSIYFSIITE
jgi:predicted RNase H-like HicB family nuclease